MIRALVSVPRRLVLAPHRPLLARGARARQVGLAPRSSVVVGGLPAAVLPLLERLRAPAVALDWVAEAAARGVGVEFAQALLRGLVERGALVDPAAGERRVQRRAASAVQVRGDGPLAVGVAVALARAGVGAVQVVARGHVESADVGCGYGEESVGGPRAEAAADAVLRVRAGTATGALPPGRSPDLVVLTDAVVPEPEVVTDLAATGTDHLPVLVRDGLGVVGPLVLVGRSPCLRCVELGRGDLDPAWPVVAAQLTGRSGGAEPEAVAATAALGAAQALLALDGERPPPTLGAALELDVHGGGLHRRLWQSHPDCHCGGGPPPAPVRVATPRTSAAEAGEAGEAGAVGEAGSSPRTERADPPRAVATGPPSSAGVTQTSPTCAADARVVAGATCVPAGRRETIMR
ncbi:ThiF family adenylyltransferase [Pseudonocardia kujensis]|uniref:ThiF family adenylyltransferase n=1 Tax=Pseudonocardia kujensis TaxID=1128675 RepID=UPI001E615073|nr:ThiF family adenylyltransferase [Pseudonocardia kujensis]MCE0768290.1 ThiF family adenylyltransferase [Pseudonocardia kujensis]